LANKYSKLVKATTLDEAREVIKRFYTNEIGEPIRTPFFLGQLQIHFEKNFFPWISYNGLESLVEDGFLTTYEYDDIYTQDDGLENITKLKFYARSDACNTSGEEETMKRHAYLTGKVVDEYSSVENRDMIGKHLHALVKLTLQAEGFKIVDENSNEYNGRNYTRTNHDLDIIAKHRENENFAIGVEIKNTLDIMNPELIDTKINICEDLGLIPVFAIRWNKPHIECILNQNGFSWVFKTQMYPLGQENFVEKIYKRLSAKWKASSKSYEYKYPIIVRTELPPKSVIKFREWVERNLANPPQVDTSERCKR